MRIVLWYDFFKCREFFEPMSTTKISTKTLKGKYQITRNIFVTCYLDILEASDKEIRTFLGLKKRSDTLVSIGTKIYFNAETNNKINVRRSNTYDIFSITVLEIEDMDGKPLHVCTPILKESRPDLRGEERLKTEFYLELEGAGTDFLAKSGTVKGLTLHYRAKKAMLSLTLHQEYSFKVIYKGELHRLPGEIKHIQYDWKSHDHIVGVAFNRLTREQETILNLLIDPSFTIDITGKQTIDSALGKISQDDG
jgi:hypothetical protein